MTDIGTEGPELRARAGLQAYIAGLEKELEQARTRERELAASEARFRAIVSQSSVGAAETDLTGRFTLVNDRYCEITGRTRAELLGLRMQDITHPDDLPDNLPLFQRAAAGGASFVIEKRYLKPDGTVVWVQNSVTGITMDGVPTGVMAITLDITERRQAETALRESEGRFRGMLEALPAGAYTCDADGLITYYNARAVELWGRAPALNDQVDRYCGSVRLFAPDRRPIAHNQSWMALALKQDTDFTGEQILIERPDGSRLTALAHATPMHDQSGRLTGAVNVLVDITERDRVERELAGLAAIVESSGDAIIGTDRNGIITSWNRGAEELLGAPAEMMVGRPVAILDPPGEPGAANDGEGERAEERRVRREVRLLRPDGSIADVSLTVSPVRNAQGEIIGASRIARDISERKREAGLLAGLLAGLSHVLEMIAGNAELPAILDALTVLMEEQADARPAASILLAESDGQLRHAAGRSLPEEGARWTTPILSDNGAELGTLVLSYQQPHSVSARDQSLAANLARKASIAITRRQGEAALRQSEEELRILQQVGSTLASELDLQKVVQATTDAGRELTDAEFGAFFYNVADDAGERFQLHTVSGAPLEALAGFAPPRFSGEGTVRLDDAHQDPRYRHLTPHYGLARDRRPVRSYLAVPVPSASGELLGGLFFGHSEPGRFTARAERLLEAIAKEAAIAIDNAQLYERAQLEVTQRAHAEEAARESERRYRSLVEATTQVIWTCDPEGRVITEQPAWAAFSGQSFDAYRDFGWTETIHPDDREPLFELWDAAVREQAFPATEARLRRYDGIYRLFSIRIVPITDGAGALREWVGACSDITERVRSEEQLRQAQALQASGTLAGGVAHEVNNQMTVVLGFGSFVLDELGPGHPQAADVQQMVRAAERAAAVTQQLLAFSRQQIIRPRVLALPLVIEELRPVLVRLLGADKTLVVPPSQSRGMVNIDPTRIEQILINLTANSRDAMRPGGRMTITLEDTTLDQGYAQAHGHIHLLPGRYVLMAVSDNGEGMDRSTLSQVFEPFFTTKPVGQGTGLGLSMVYGLVKQHGGFVWAYSEPGQGTTIKVYLPAVESTEEQGARASVPTAAEPARRAQVLVVEDEPMVLALARRTLESAGHAVLAASNGQEALDLLKRWPAPLDLLVTDVVMPAMDGRELSEQLRRTQPGLPVL